jgi:hypothetical protein
MSADPVDDVMAPVDTATKSAPKPKPFNMKGQTQAGWIGKEKARLKKLEGIVQRGMSTFIEVGNALTEIRRDKLYRLSPFGGQGATFEEYAFRKFGHSRAHANRHIKAAEVQTILSPIGDKTPSENRLPNEAVARELARLLKWPDQLKQAWENLKSNRTKLLQVEKQDFKIDRLAAVTAKAAAKEVARFLPPPKPKAKTVEASAPNSLAAELRALWSTTIGANVITHEAIDLLIDKLNELRGSIDATA